MISKIPWSDSSIQTIGGAEFFPLAPRARDVDPREIAHALGYTCRYTGHCRFFFSVAQHSVLMTRYYRDHRPDGDANAQRWALLHDASEAYLPDVAGPVKPHLAGFGEIEDRLLEVIAARFGLGPVPDGLAWLDRMMYWRERQVLLPHADWVYARREAWDVPSEFAAAVPIEPWDVDRGRVEWLHEFTRLF